MYEVTDMNGRAYSVTASRITMTEGSYIFWNNDRIVAAFPLRNTAAVQKR